jgi:hypothetical protein
MGSSVGNSEVHSVLIENQKPVTYGGVRKHTLRVFIDEVLLGEHRHAILIDLPYPGKVSP